ncbi:MAG: YopX family protein [Peptostreptococcaceae bacterium]|nr:YopX family protein [Peptostreptococcaceae bacterium]
MEDESSGKKKADKGEDGVRKIKFRAFLKSNQKMYDVLTLDIIDKKALIENTDNKKRPLRGYVKMSEIELMQYTGLKDRNGQEIYEGDIVRHKYGPQILMRVAWDDEYPGFGTFGKYNGEPYVGYVKSSCEVVGNIYEHPELLEAHNV